VARFTPARRWVRVAVALLSGLQSNNTQSELERQPFAQQTQTAKQPQPPAPMRMIAVRKHVHRSLTESSMVENADGVADLCKQSI